MEINENFREFIELLNEHEVQYLVTAKKAAGRLQDLADAEQLEKLKRKWDESENS